MLTALGEGSRPCNYIQQRSSDFQCIVISLKDMFYERSESLVGICRDVSSNSSRTMTLDLTKFDRKKKTKRALEDPEDDDATALSKRSKVSSDGEEG